VSKVTNSSDILIAYESPSIGTVERIDVDDTASLLQIGHLQLLTSSTWGFVFHKDGPGQNVSIQSRGLKGIVLTLPSGGHYEVRASGDAVAGFLENGDTSSSRFSVTDRGISFIRQGIFRFFPTDFVTMSRDLVSSDLLPRSGMSDAPTDSVQVDTSAGPTESADALGESGVLQSFAFQKSSLANQTNDLDSSFEFPDSSTFTLRPGLAASHSFGTPESQNFTVPARNADDGGNRGNQTLVVAIGRGAGVVVLAAVITLVVKLVHKNGINRGDSEAEDSLGEPGDLDDSLIKIVVTGLCFPFPSLRQAGASP
jgi:hypothetical protein